MKRDKLRIGVITAALAMMIAGGVLTWQQDARNGKADQAKQGETAQLTEDESTGTTEQQTEETAGDADGGGGKYAGRLPVYFKCPGSDR